MKKELQKNWNYFRFEELRVYQKAIDYAVWLHVVTTGVTLEHRDETGRLMNAASQIAFLIAEGSMRNKSQFVHHLKMARSQIRECVVRTTICQKLGVLSVDHEAYSRGQLCELSKMIGALGISVIKIPVYHTEDEDDFTIPVDDCKEGGLSHPSIE